MQFYRLIKPLWGKPKLDDGKENPKFKEKIKGPNILEGCNFSKKELREYNRKGYNIYFFPNHPSKDVYSEGTRFLSGRLIDVFNYVFVDMDLKDKVYGNKDEFYEKLKCFGLMPSMTVDSGNGVHAYWRLSDLDRLSYVQLQCALIKHFNTDNSIWTVLQLMRVPGFKNTKQYDNYKDCKIVEDLSSGKQYQISDLPKIKLGKSEVTEIREKAKRHVNKLDGKVEYMFSGKVDFDDLPDRFERLLDSDDRIRLLFEDPKSTGDRSASDFILTNLLYSNKFTYKEACVVIANTQKALEKGNNRDAYVQTTVNKVYGDRPKHNIKNIFDWLESEDGRTKESLVGGPEYLDAVLGEPWRKHEMLGIIAGAGVGKTSMALNIIWDIIKNNRGRDEVYVFFSLEMSKRQIASRWVDLVGDDEDAKKRLFVVDTQDDEGNPLILGLQEMYEICEEIKQTTSKGIGAFVIDHFHIISTHIDVRKKPKFGIESVGDTGYGNIQNLTLNDLANQLKQFTKVVDTFGIILTQTTKVKGQGDTPIDKDGAYGVSQYEWFMDRIMTIWQPLMRVQHLTPLRFLAFQYTKIREKRTEDKIQTYMPRLLTYDLKSGLLRPTIRKEKHIFEKYLPQAVEARKKATSNEQNDYYIHVDLGDPDELIKKVIADE